MNNINITSEERTLLGINLIEELGLGPLSEKDKDKFLNDAADVLGRRIMLKAMEKLSAKDTGEFASAIKANPNAVEQFLLERIPDLSEMVAKELAQFKGELLISVNNQE